MMNKKELLEELQAEKNYLEAMEDEKIKAEDKLSELEHPIFIAKEQIEYIENELKEL